MKTLFLVSLLAVTMVVMVLIIDRNETNIDKLITVDTFYSFLANREMSGTFHFYVSDLDNPVTDLDSYLHVYITNANGSKRLEIDLEDITVRHQEEHLHERYWKIDLSFAIPNLSDDFVIDSCSIVLTLIDQSSISLDLGSVHFLVAESEDRTLDWQSLYGVKEENAFLSRIDSIHLELNEDIALIEAQYGVDCYAMIDQSDRMIVLNIEKDAQLLYNIPVILRYIKDSVEHVTIIENFTYVLDYQILLESGPLIHVYAFD